MSNERPVTFADIFLYCFFLENTAEAIQNRGIAVTKGELFRRAKNAGSRLPLQEFASAEELIKAINEGQSAFTRIEGIAQHQGNHIFALKTCAFAYAMKNYTSRLGIVDHDFQSILDEYNKPNPLNDQFKLGEGSAINVFCCIHQALRSIIGSKHRVQQQPVSIYILGCKSLEGKKGFAKKYIEAAGVTQEKIDKILDENMCCYWLKIG